MNWLLFWAVLATITTVLLAMSWVADRSVFVGKLQRACDHDPAGVIRYHGDAAMRMKRRWECTNCGLKTGAVAGPPGWERRYGEGREKA